MPVTTAHPSYDEYLGMWTKCRDAHAGSEVIKAKGAEYLPKLSGQSINEYNAYKGRALFYGITAKTVSGLVGMSVSIPPVIESPEDMENLFKGANSLKFVNLWSMALQELLVTARFGVLIDAPVSGGDAYASMYPTESILNWYTDDVGNPVLVVLFEAYHAINANDRYLRELKKQYRVLELIDGVYSMSVWGEDGNQIGATTQPKFKGQTIEYIPFRCVNPTGFGFEPVKSPMLDIVNINISHYMSSADLEHGRHFTGLPTPVVIGVDSDSTLHIGSTSAWVIPMVGGDAKYLEFTGQGLQSLEKALVEKQSQLASMSARLIDNSSKGSESADIVRLRYSSEAATLAGTVNTVSALLDWVYKTIAKLKGESEESVSIQLSTDFVSGRLSTKEIADLTQAYIEGGISTETLIYNLRRGQVYSINQKDSDEIEAIKTLAKEKKEKQDVKVPVE
jgi:hypothetical protein